MWDQIVNSIKGLFNLPGDLSKGTALAGEVWTTLTDFRMWRSLGWLLLGIILIIIGFVIWNRHAIGQAASTVAAAA